MSDSHRLPLQEIGDLCRAAASGSGGLSCCCQPRRPPALPAEFKQRIALRSGAHDVSLVRCFYHPGYFFPLPEEHPFPMDKFWRAAEMVRAECPAVRIVPIELAPVVQLLRVHTPSYLTAIRTGTLARDDQVRLGLPPCESLLSRCRRETAGTVAAMWAALDERLACNLAGGTHHAFPDRGLGYCVLNDVAIAIRDLHAVHPDRRIFVIDTDAHQGNGSNGIFAGDERVFTYSIHVGRNYPAEKTAGSLDVELPRHVSGADYLEQLEASLPLAFERFGPDIAFWISGSDPHENDRFGQMKLSDGDLDARDRAVLELVTRHGVPTAVLYGGGYNRERVHTARLHANTIKMAEGFWKRSGVAMANRVSSAHTGSMKTAEGVRECFAEPGVEDAGWRDKIAIPDWRQR